MINKLVTTPGVVAELDGMPGIDPAWSRLIHTVDAEGVLRSWHVLDNGVVPQAGTLLCVHGNPTWSYLWRRFLACADPGWRVVAIGHTPARLTALNKDARVVTRPVKTELQARPKVPKVFQCIPQ